MGRIELSTYTLRNHATVVSNDVRQWKSTSATARHPPVPRGRGLDLLPQLHAFKGLWLQVAVKSAPRWYQGCGSPLIRPDIGTFQGTSVDWSSQSLHLPLTSGGLARATAGGTSAGGGAGIPPFFFCCFFFFRVSAIVDETVAPFLQCTLRLSLIYGRCRRPLRCLHVGRQRFIPSRLFGAMPPSFSIPPTSCVPRWWLTWTAYVDSPRGQGGELVVSKWDSASVTFPSTISVDAIN